MHVLQGCVIPLSRLLIPTTQTRRIQRDCVFPRNTLSRYLWHRKLSQEFPVTRNTLNSSGDWEFQWFLVHSGWVGFCWNERANSVESSLQGISSNSLLWKRNIVQVVIQTWSGRGKPATSARAWLRHATPSASIVLLRGARQALAPQPPRPTRNEPEYTRNFSQKPFFFPLESSLPLEPNCWLTAKSIPRLILEFQNLGLAETQPAELKKMENKGFLGKIPYKLWRITSGVQRGWRPSACRAPKC